jgi:hypothetical protein
MASSELTDLTNAATLAQTDLVYAVVDPAGTPLDRKATIATLKTAVGWPGISTLAAYPRTGVWNGPSIDIAADATASALVDEQERAVPLIVLVAGTIDRIGVKTVGTVGSSGSVIRLGIRNDAGGYPGATVILDAGTVIGTANADLAITVSQALPAGIYWLTCTSQGAASTQPSVNSGPNGTARLTLTGNTSQAAVSNPNWSSATAPIQTGVSGALPSSWTGTSRASQWPLISVRWA